MSVCIHPHLELAQTCVFDKQSLLPLFCGHQTLTCGSSPVAPLIPKLRGHFAEFLHESSLDRLRILSSPTCVSFGTGTYSTPHEAFLGDVSGELGHPKVHILPPLAMSSRICLRLGLRSHATSPSVATPGLSTSRPLLDQNSAGGVRIFTHYPSPTPFGLGLGPD